MKLRRCPNCKSKNTNFNNVGYVFMSIGDGSCLIDFCKDCGFVFVEMKKKYDKYVVLTSLDWFTDSVKSMHQWSKPLPKVENIFEAYRSMWRILLKKFRRHK